MLLYLKDEHTRHSEVICNFDLLPPNTHKHMHAHATTFAGRDMSYIRRAITMEVLELDQRRSASNCRAVVPHELLISGSGASSLRGAMRGAATNDHNANSRPPPEELATLKNPNSIITFQALAIGNHKNSYTRRIPGNS